MADGSSSDILWPGLYTSCYTVAVSAALLLVLEPTTICLSPLTKRLSVYCENKMVWIIYLGICWMALLGVVISISQATCLLGQGDRLQCFKHRLFMINRDNSVFCRHLAWLLHLWAMRSSYWLSLSPTSHFVSVSGSLRDRRARQSYKVKYLGLALALQVSVIILLEAFLLCWIIMEVRVYACHLSSVGGGSQREAQDREMFAFLLCHPKEHKSKANLYCSLSAQQRLIFLLLLNMWHANLESFQLRMW